MLRLTLYKYRPKQKENEVVRLCICRYITKDSPNTGFPVLGFSTNNSPSLKDAIVDKLRNVMVVYEDFIGVKDVQAAHKRVMQTEEKFILAQEQRRSAHKELTIPLEKLRELRSELDRIPRGNEKYLELVTKELNLMREEKQRREEFEDHEKSERIAFNELSSALRFSHEKEKAQNEKTKYWSVIGSLVGAFVGIVGTSINSRMKIQQLRKVMEESSAQSLSQVQDKLNILFSQIDAASKAKQISTSSEVVVDPSNNVEIESIISTKVNLLTQQIDEFNDRLQKVQLPAQCSSPLENINNNNDTTQLKSYISYATVTILIGVPIISRLLGSFFRD